MLVVWATRIYNDALYSVAKIPPSSIIFKY
jgi:hypothetical protein